MSDTNINMLQTVANGLEELKEEMVFIGGAVALLYADDPAATDIRATPMEEKILGFSNRWYNEGIENKTRITLPDKTEIYIFSPEYYLASKFEAHNGRGGEDLRQSHDFEDIIYLLDNCTNVLEIVIDASGNVKDYLKKQCKALLNNKTLSKE